MELISDVSSFVNSSINQSINQSIKQNNNNLENNNIEKQFELDKIKEENLQKYNDIKSNAELLYEVINELEIKSQQIQESIKYIENIHRESLTLFKNITR